MTKRRTLISAKTHLLDLTSIIPTLKSEMGMVRNGVMVSFLNGLVIDGRTFRFLHDDSTFQKIFVLCPNPNCARPRRLHLHKVDGRWLCRDCHQLRRPSRMGRSSKVYTRYIRPLRLLAKINERLFSTATLSPGGRARLEKKALSILRAMPEYVVAISEETRKLANLARS